MIVEVIAVGTELLLGQSVNSNAAVIGERLADAGLDHFHQVVVGDNEERIAAAIAAALERSDAAILTGGLGPTQDDVTREAISRVTGRRLVRDEEFAVRLREYWSSRGREMPVANLRQADRPEGAEFIPNEKGTAPGLIVAAPGGLIFALPGVPEEMAAMLDGTVLPRLTAAAGGDRVIVSRLLRTWGSTESRIAEMLGDVFAAATNPTVAFLASGGEIKVRLTAQAADAGRAEALIAPVEAEVRRRLESLIFGVDADTVEAVLLRVLEERSWSLGTAESATGGLVAGRFTSIPGASRVFRGAIVAYHEELKASLLAVPGPVLDAGVVSEDTALAMAAGAALALETEVAVAVTGSAGPDLQEHPAGTMWIAVQTPEDARARMLRLPGDRERVRTYTVSAALHLVRRAVTGEWW
jgi:nicotinamide-nucleotide amidase